MLLATGAWTPQIAACAIVIVAIIIIVVVIIDMVSHDIK